MLIAQGKPDGDFLRLYQGNRRESVKRSLDSSPVATAVRQLVADREYPWTGNWKQLLSDLSGFRDGSEAWPRSPRGLGDALRRQRPALAQVGISIGISPHGRTGVTVTVKRGENYGRDGCDGCDGSSDGVSLTRVCDPADDTAEAF